MPTEGGTWAASLYCAVDFLMIFIPIWLSRCSRGADYLHRLWLPCAMAYTSKNGASRICNSSLVAIWKWIETGSPVIRHYYLVFNICQCSVKSTHSNSWCGGGQHSLCQRELTCSSYWHWTDCIWLCFVVKVKSWLQLQCLYWRTALEWDCIQPFHCWRMCILIDTEIDWLVAAL